MLLQDQNSNLVWKILWEVIYPTPMLRAGTFSRWHLVAQSCVTLNVSQIDGIWFLIYYKVGILSSFYTTVGNNLCLLRKICQYLKAWLNTFRSKKIQTTWQKSSPQKIQLYNFKKGVKKESAFLLPSYTWGRSEITWGRSEMIWLLSIYRFNNVPVYTYYT